MKKVCILVTFADDAALISAGWVLAAFFVKIATKLAKFIFSN